MRNEKNLPVHELIGLEVLVKNSTCKNCIGTSGKVVDETKNTLLIESGGKEKRVPKKGSTFTFTLEENKVDIEGNGIAYGPVERPKKIGV